MRKHPRRAQVDPTHPKAWGSSDRDGMVGNLANMRFQHEWRGPRIVNTRMLVHEDELDLPQRQLGSPALLGPDPVPVANARPEQYPIDEYWPRLYQGGQPRYLQGGIHPRYLQVSEYFSTTRV